MGLEMKKGNRIIKAKRWYIVTWINPKISKDYPKLNSIFGSDEVIKKDDNLIYHNRDFVEHYHVKRILTLRKYRKRFELNDLLDKAKKRYLKTTGGDKNSKSP